MKRRRWTRLSAILALTGVAIVALLLGPLSSAVGFFSGGLSLDVQIQSPATLVSRGAAINVPLEIVCTSPRADLFVQVTERREARSPKAPDTRKSPVKGTCSR
jgi:hypothetical protein